MESKRYIITIIYESDEYGVFNDCDVVKRHRDEILREILFNPGDKLKSVKAEQIKRK